MANCPSTTVMWVGDSIGAGSFSTSALQLGGARYLMEVAAAAAGKSLLMIGSQGAVGTWAHPRCECYPGNTIDVIRQDSAAARKGMQPEGMILEPGTNDIGNGTSAAALETLYSTLVSECWDAAAHRQPDGTSTLKWMVIQQILRRPNHDSVVVDFNTNHLPNVIAPHVAIGRPVFIAQTYAAVTSFAVDGSGGIHPDDTGYTQMWGALAPIVLPLLRST